MIDMKNASKDTKTPVTKTAEIAAVKVITPTAINEPKTVAAVKTVSK
jgi:hypothetical protein